MTDITRKIKTIALNVTDGETVEHELFRGDSQFHESIDEDRLIQLIDHAVDNKYYITIHPTPLGEMIRDEGSIDTIDAPYDHYACTSKVIESVADDLRTGIEKATKLSKQDDKLYDLNSVSLPIIKSQMHALLFSELVNNFCVEHGLQCENGYYETDINTVIGDQ